MVKIEMEKHGGVERESGDSREWDKEEFSGMKKNVGRRREEKYRGRKCTWDRGQRWCRRMVVKAEKRKKVVRESGMLARVGR